MKIPNFIKEIFSEKNIFYINTALIFACSAYILKDFYNNEQDSITTEKEQAKKKKGTTNNTKKIKKSELKEIDEDDEQFSKHPFSVEEDTLSNDEYPTRKGSENIRGISTNKGIENINYLKIAFSGGPCAGKTTSISLVADMLRDRGFSVYIVPEAATLIFTSGGKLDMSKWSESEIIKFQISLLKIQMSLEDKFLEFGLTEKSKMPIIILCDRGTMDGKAYTQPQDWQIILDELGVTDIQLRDDRYDAVIHLITAADGAEEYYNLNNQARYENSIEIAKKVDKNLQMAWLGHPYRFVIDNKEKGFETKMKKVEEAVFQILGFPISINFHKKYLMKELKIKSPNSDLKRSNSHNFGDQYLSENEIISDPILHIPEDLKPEIFYVEDTYLKRKDQEVIQRIRRRAQNNSSIFILYEVKFINNESIETKRRISSKDYVTYFSQRDTARRTIKKVRVCFMWNLETYIIEIFKDEKNPKNNFSILIVQTQFKEKPENINLPNFILSGLIRDITDEITYHPYNMSKADWTLPTDDKNKIYENDNVII